MKNINIKMSNSNSDPKRVDLDYNKHGVKLLRLESLHMKLNLHLSCFYQTLFKLLNVSLSN